ncbi:MAG: murein biosynthesis integral membrane protein MurJ [Candidatus Tectomicrobia bacterium RIFCSPLOWO2_12_FULL_69_37]|nr:MAG: murein biosynthesis integral membrane protein MurJ [Candidatus Tectomicrobia bacterium RIFCSPLOWO2_12_FULL_69_37]
MAFESGSPPTPPDAPPREGISRSAGAIGLATLISRVAGFLRDILIARALGAGLAADAFFVAFAIPALFRNLFMEGALNSSLIPSYTEVRKEGGEAAARRFTGGVAVLVGVFLAAMCALGVLFSGTLVAILASGFSRQPEKFDLAVRLTRLMFPFLFFIGMWAIAAGLLNAARRFFVPAVTPAVQNLVMVAALLAAGWLGAGERTVYWLAAAVVAGGALQALCQVPLLVRLGLFPAPAAPWSAPGIGRFLTLMGPAAFAAAIFHLNSLANRWLASFLEEGAISYLYYANRLVQFPHGILSLAVMAAAFPVLAERAAEGRRNQEGAGEGWRRTLAESGRLTLYITLPATFGLIALAHPIMEVLFQRGAFGPGQTAASAAALRAYALGLAFFGFVRLFSAAFHTRLDTRYPMRCAYASVAANIAFSLILMFPLGFVGLALGTTLSSALNAVLLIRGLRRVGGEWPGEELGRAARQLLLPAAGVGAAAWLAHWALWPAGAPFALRALALMIIVAAAAGSYALLCEWLAPQGKVPLRGLLRLGRRASPSSSA